MAAPDIRPPEPVSGPVHMDLFGSFEVGPSGNAFGGLTEALRRSLREDRWSHLMLPGREALRAGAPAAPGASACECSREGLASLLTLAGGRR